jgi:hypothetical protein
LAKMDVDEEHLPIGLDSSRVMSLENCIPDVVLNIRDNVVLVPLIIICLDDFGVMGATHHCVKKVVDDGIMRAKPRL